MKKLLLLLLLLPTLLQAQITVPQADIERLFRGETVRFGNVIDVKATSIVGKIPYVPYWAYQNDKTSLVYAEFFDGNTVKNPNMGYSSMITPSDVVFAFPEQTNAYLTKIRLYDGQGSTIYPTEFYAVDKNHTKRLLGTFNGSKYNTWLEIPVNQSVSAIVMRLTSPGKGRGATGMPSELEFIGSYTPYTAPVAKMINYPFKGQTGVNSYVWYFNNARPADRVDPERAVKMKQFSWIRDYVDWQKIESRPGEYHFNWSLDGGWNYDAMYEYCNANGIEVVPCLKTVPKWFSDANYPLAQREHENVPARWSDNPAELLAIRENPDSYKQYADAVYQFVARYGYNKVDTALLKISKVQLWKTATMNVKKSGLGYIKYIEFNNEPDRSWKGAKAFQTGREYGAFLSACYDAAKRADPNIKIVVAGIANTRSEYFRGIVEWSKEHGKKQLYDVLNIHAYSNTAGGEQYAGSKRGIAPELNTKIRANLLELRQISNEFLGDAEYWITETGYDVGNTTQATIAIGDKNKRLVQADWILRSALLYSRLGVARTAFYQGFDDSGYRYDSTTTIQYMSSGIGNRPAGAYLKQTHDLMGEYTFKESISAYPAVDHYTHNGKSIYVGWVPNEIGDTKEYTFNLTGNLFRHTLQQTGNVMVKEPIGKTVTLTETPIFITVE